MDTVTQDAIMDDAIPPAMSPTPLQGISASLVQESALSPSEALRAEGEAREKQISTMQYLVESGLVTPRQAALAASREYGLPLIDLDTLSLDDLPPANELPVALLRKLGVMPLCRGDRHFTVAIPYPSTLARLDELRFAIGQPIEGVLAPVDQLQPALESYLSRERYPSRVSSGSGHAGTPKSPDHDTATSYDTQGSDDRDSDDAALIRFVDRVLREAIERGASDIHFEPYENSYRIRLRIDGILLEMARPPLAMHPRVAARLKVMARLDIAERRLPQDGTIKLRLPERGAIDLRVNSLPIVHGEKIVLRILDPASARLGIDALGFTAEQRQHYERALAQPQGMILVTGPTGSGKTVTLYTGLNILNTTERNIATAEDPVELKVAGVNQVNVNPRIGLDFASALRAFLRQDPDIVMVGEIRDLETAEIAVKASQTGHLVLSTVHTNSAAETLTRLSHMGVAAFDIASSVSLIIAQRLARKLCPHCKTPANVPRGILREEGFSDAELDGIRLYRPTGCRHCTLGYRGRVGIYEVLPISDTIRQSIMRHGNALELDEQARREGHPGLRRSGLLKVMQGVTSLEEVNRVTKS